MVFDRTLKNADIRRETGMSPYCTTKFLSKYGFFHNRQLCILESVFTELLQDGSVEEFKKNLRKVKK